MNLRGFLRIFEDLKEEIVEEFGVRDPVCPREHWRRTQRKPDLEEVISEGTHLNSQGADLRCHVCNRGCGDALHTMNLCVAGPSGTTPVIFAYQTRRCEDMLICLPITFSHRE